MFQIFQNFDWKNSKAHLLLLSKFIRAQEVGYFVERDYWEKVLNESPQKSIKRFIDEGMLTNADLETIVSYKFKIPELKELCKQRRLAVSGDKNELIKRLIQADGKGLRKAVSEIKLMTFSPTQASGYHNNLS